MVRPTATGPVDARADSDHPQLAMEKPRRRSLAGVGPPRWSVEGSELDLSQGCGRGPAPPLGAAPPLSDGSWGNDREWWVSFVKDMGFPSFPLVGTWVSESVEPQPLPEGRPSVVPIRTLPFLTGLPRPTRGRSQRPASNALSGSILWHPWTEGWPRAPLHAVCDQGHAGAGQGQGPEVPRWHVSPSSHAVRGA